MILTYRSPLERGRIKSVDFPEEQYMQEEHEKKMIVLHHTAGWDNGRGVFDWWASNKQRVATCCAVEDNGKIIQGFSSRFYGWHVNVWSKYNQLPQHLKSMRKPASYYEKHSIGVELTNWGPIQYRGGKFYSWPNNYGLQGKAVEIDPQKTPLINYTDGFRGHRYYEAYTDHQVQTTYDLCKFWQERYDIPFTFKSRSQFFDVNTAAISGARGIHAHVGFRTDKFDIHPQNEILDMLSDLSR